MRAEANVAVIIPALNEARAIAKVLHAIPAWVDDIIVVDNGSTDATVRIARAHGARVVYEPRRGYGSTCLSGIAALDQPDIVVFLDADFSDDPKQMHRLVDPIVANASDLVMGCRVPQYAERGALSLPQRLGNRFACALMRLLWGTSFTDLAPFRAISYRKLIELSMQDRGYGWTLEMQLKAALCRLHVLEIPVRYRRRIGQSKISGTVRGVLCAGGKISWVILAMALKFGLRRGHIRPPASNAAQLVLHPVIDDEPVAVGDSMLSRKL